MARSLRISEAVQNIDLTGKQYVVTGGTSGAGQGTVEFLAKRGAEVVTSGRNLERGEKNFSSLSSEVRSRITLLKMDLCNMDDVEAFANHINQNWEKLDGLVNNAGGALLTKSPNAFIEKNGQKYCSQFIGNHIGPFHLTNLLLPLLEKTNGSRIINLSSVMHDQAKGMQSSRAVIDFDDIHYRNKKFDGFEAYAQSKLANLLHAKSLARKYTVDQIAIFPVHPGTVAKGSNFGREFSPLMQIIMKPMFLLMGPMMRPITLDDGAQTSLHCLLSDEALGHHGMYHAQTGIKHSDGIRGGWPYKSANPLSHDESVQDKLWEVSELLVAEMKA